MAQACAKYLYVGKARYKMLEAHIDNKQLKDLTNGLNLTEKQLLNLAKKVFKMSAKDFAKKVIKRANSEYKISQKKLKERIKQFVINDLKIKIFSGFYRVGLTHWRARQLGKARKRRSARSGVEYGAPDNRQLRAGAFIITSKRKDGSPGGKVAFKRTSSARLPIQKQVTDIDEVITPILESEVENFYNTFSARFDRECIKYLGN